MEDFLDSLTDQNAQKVAWVLKLIEDIDIVPRQYFKKLAGTDGIWEVRVKAGKQTVRLLGFTHGLRLIVLTNGFFKKSEQIPAKEIELAEHRKRDYLRRTTHE